MIAQMGGNRNIPDEKPSAGVTGGASELLLFATGQTGGNAYRARHRLKIVSSFLQLQQAGIMAFYRLPGQEGGHTLVGRMFDDLGGPSLLLEAAGQENDKAVG